MRINKYIAASTALSRRAADDALVAGRVTYNTKIATPGIDVMPGDVVMLDGKEITPLESVYYAIHKPIGYTTTTKDPHAAKIVTELVPATPPVFPVGRLDKNSRGLLICTNDGDFSFRLSHPSHEHTKEYLVTVDHAIDARTLKKLQHGIALDEGLAVFDSISMERDVMCRVVLHQGWKRQIRRMFAACGYEVVDLFRVRIGALTIDNIPEGLFITIKPRDVL